MSECPLSPNLPKAKDRRQAPEAQRMADSQASAITAAGNDPRPQKEADQPQISISGAAVAKSDLGHSRSADSRNRPVYQSKNN